MFIIQSVHLVCFVIYSINLALDPKFEVSACAVNFFILDLFAFPKSFFPPWAFTVLYFSTKRFSQNSPKFKKCFSRHFRGLRKQLRVSFGTFSSYSYIICCPFSRERGLFGCGFNDPVPLHKLSAKVDNDQPCSQSTLSCFKKKRLSL